MPFVLKPQRGPQEMFLSCQADICIYGGAAGGGKTFGLLLEPLRHIHNSNFGAVIFRKNYNQVFAQGGLWDTSNKIYPYCGARPTRSPKAAWIFHGGMKVTFAHLEFEKDVLSWQGSQIPLIMFDELTHFTKRQFFYMLSRNRSDSGVKGYLRATTNPDADSWVAEFISWWIDEKTGYPMQERSGVIRYMYYYNDVIYWADTREELFEKFSLYDENKKMAVKSVTFIASKLTDNKILMNIDPGYIGNLQALPEVERERLLNGNWKIRPAAGLYFKRAYFNMVDTIPDDVIRWVRAWDFAATADRKNSKPGEGPAYTAGVLIGKRRNGRYIIADDINSRLSALEVEKAVLNTAVIDKQKYKRVRVRLSQDPGQAGKAQVEYYIKMLAGFDVTAQRETGSKETRAEPFAAQCQAGNVDVLTAPWNEAYFAQLESFPESVFKDMVDASSNGFNEICGGYAAVVPPVEEGNGDRESMWNM